MVGLLRRVSAATSRTFKSWSSEYTGSTPDIAPDPRGTVESLARPASDVSFENSNHVCPVFSTHALHACLLHRSRCERPSRRSSGSASGGPETATHRLGTA